jgi:hypothetical protein
MELNATVTTINIFITICRCNPITPAHLLLAEYNIDLMDAERTPSIASISLFLMGNGPKSTQDYNNPLNFQQKQNILDLKLRDKKYSSNNDYVIRENVGGPLKQIPEFIRDLKYPNLSTINLIIVGGAKEDEAGVKDSEKFNSLFEYVVRNLVNNGFNVSFGIRTMPTVALSGTTMSATLMRHTARTKTLEEFIKATDNFYGNLSEDVYTTIRSKIENSKSIKPSKTTRKQIVSKATVSKATGSKASQSNETGSKVLPIHRFRKGGSKNIFTRKQRLEKVTTRKNNHL